jgi:hypothetical protein
LLITLRKIGGVRARVRRWWRWANCRHQWLPNAGGALCIRCDTAKRLPR